MSCDQTAFIMRPARPEDKTAVLAFCEHTFEWGDYVPLVWDEWLADRQGQLLVAEADGVPVGLAKVSLLTPNEAWLQGLRVHPQHRRQGLAGEFLGQCLQIARQLGASVARFATSSANTAVQKTAQRAGMRRVASLSLLDAPALPSAESVALVPLGTAAWAEVRTRVLDSAALKEMAGLYGIWDWQTLTAPRLREHLERGQVLGLFHDNRLVATAVLREAEVKESYLPVAFLEADAAWAQPLARALRHHGSILQVGTVEVVMPSTSALRLAFLQTGYKPETESEHEVWIYELDLKGGAL